MSLAVRTVKRENYDLYNPTRDVMKLYGSVMRPSKAEQMLASSKQEPRSQAEEMKRSGIPFRSGADTAGFSMGVEPLAPKNLPKNSGYRTYADPNIAIAKTRIMEKVRHKEVVARGLENWRV
jgi:hypothetical protein